MALRCPADTTYLHRSPHAASAGKAPAFRGDLLPEMINPDTVPALLERPLLLFDSLLSEGLRHRGLSAALPFRCCT